jgi:hypothetical protein
MCCCFCSIFFLFSFFFFFFFFFSPVEESAAVAILRDKWKKSYLDPEFRSWQRFVEPVLSSSMTATESNHVHWRKLCWDCKTVRLLGSPGSGKTSLLKEVAFEWASCGLFASQFDIVLFVPWKSWSEDVWALVSETEKVWCLQNKGENCFSPKSISHNCQVESCGCWTIARLLLIRCSVSTC